MLSLINVAIPTCDSTKVDEFLAKFGCFVSMQFTLV